MLRAIVVDCPSIQLDRIPFSLNIAIMDDIGTYQERKFPAFRNPTIDVLEHGRKKHHIPLLLEIDVTEGRSYLRQIKVATGQSLSFTTWVMACVGQAVSEHKHVHALRHLLVWRRLARNPFLAKKNDGHRGGHIRRECGQRQWQRLGHPVGHPSADCGRGQHCPQAGSGGRGH